MSGEPELFQATVAELRADHLRPGDHIRRSGRNMAVERIAVTAGAPAELRLRGRDGIVSTMQLQASELVAVLS